MEKQLEETEFTKDSLRSSLEEVSSKYTSMIPFFYLFLKFAASFGLRNWNWRTDFKMYVTSDRLRCPCEQLVAFNFL